MRCLKDWLYLMLIEQFSANSYLVIDEQFMRNVLIYLYYRKC